LEKVKAAQKGLFFLAMGIATIWSFHIPPAMNFQNPQLARIFVWHFPCPMIAVSLLMLSAWFSFRYLRTHDRAWDERALASQELAFIFSVLTMLTGMLFSKVMWGAWWQQDPRQTSFLMVLVIYATYFILRGAFPDAERRAANTAAYALAAIGPALFLIFVFPRLPQIQSFHPSDTIMKGKLTGEYGIVVSIMVVLMTILSAWLYRLRIRVGLLELEKEKSYERMDARGGGPASSGVVRRISVSGEN